MQARAPAVLSGLIAVGDASAPPPDLPDRAAELDVLEVLGTSDEVLPALAARLALARSTAGVGPAVGPKTEPALRPGEDSADAEVEVDAVATPPARAVAPDAPGSPCSPAAPGSPTSPAGGRRRSGCSDASSTLSSPLTVQPGPEDDSEGSAAGTDRVVAAVAHLAGAGGWKTVVRRDEAEGWAATASANDAATRRGPRRRVVRARLQPPADDSDEEPRRG